MRLAVLLAALALLAPAGRAAADATAVALPAGLSIAGGASPTTLTAEALAALPMTTITLPDAHGTGPTAFQGPLLWTLLTKTHAVDDANPHGQGRQSVLIAGRDGFVAVIALGEISPEFEGKQVILAERRDGQALGPEHLRIIVPGDKRGGRGVHDVVSIVVQTAAKP